MHSNEQSPREDLANSEAIAKLKELAEKARNCIFSTNVSSFPHTARPMALQEVDESGKLWFISSTESHKNAEIEKDNKVTLYFQNNGAYEFLVVSSYAQIHTDKPTIEKYWTSFANAWFDGKDDPNVSVVSVDPVDSDYWDTKDGKIISFIKMSFMAVTGTKSDDAGLEGKLKV
ncbi:MAG: pyridoxamine 5'-phosphate oxidase family protein [Ferruginibacter sp.]